MGAVRFRLDGVEWRRLEGQILALDVRGSRYLSINESGRELWEALAAGATRTELVERLVEAFELDREKAEADADQFVAELEERNLLVREPS